MWTGSDDQYEEIVDYFEENPYRIEVSRDDETLMIIERGIVQTVQLYEFLIVSDDFQTTVICPTQLYKDIEFSDNELVLSEQLSGIQSLEWEDSQKFKADCFDGLMPVVQRQLVCDFLDELQPRAKQIFPPINEGLSEWLHNDTKKELEELRKNNFKLKIKNENLTSTNAKLETQNEYLTKRLSRFDIGVITEVLKFYKLSVGNVDLKKENAKLRRENNMIGKKKKSKKVRKEELEDFICS